MADGDAPIKGKTWYELDYPVLLAASELVQTSAYSNASSWDIATASRIPQPDVVRALSRLQEKYVRVSDVSGINQRDYIVTGLTTDGLVAADVWPSVDTVAERLIAALEKALDEAPADSPRASKLRQALQGLQDLGTGATGNVLGQAISSALGLV